MNLSNTQQLVLNKFKAEATARNATKPGTYEEEFFLRVHGQIKVGKDYEATRSQAVPWQQLATYLLGQVNEATRAKLVREFLEAYRDGKPQVNDEALKAEAEEAAAELLEATRTTCKGKVTGSVMVSIVTAEELEVEKAA